MDKRWLALVMASMSFSAMEAKEASKASAPAPTCCIDSASGAYNCPAQPWEQRCVTGFVEASFIYWNSNEDGLSIGRRLPHPRAETPGTLHEKIFLQDFSYKPGFKVAAGIGGSSMDNWQLAIEWTRLHQTTNADYTVDGTTQAILLESWVHLFNPSFVCNEVSSAWKMDFDTIDLALSRPFYSGKRLVLVPSLGLRALILDQSMSVTYQFTNTTPMYGNFSSDSWAIGPLVGLNGCWKLGYGFGILGKANAALMYTDYTTLSLYETIRIDSFEASDVKANYGPYRTVRASTGLGLGLDWDYSFCDRYNVYFAATYDFNVFWNQNVLRGISDNYSFGGSEAGTSSLNFQGLTLTARFGF